MASWDDMATASARQANEELNRSAVLSTQHRTVNALTDIRDTLNRIEQLLLRSTSNGESGETKGNSI